MVSMKIQRLFSALPGDTFAIAVELYILIINLLPFYINWVDTGIFITNFCDFNFVCVAYFFKCLMLYFVFNSIPSSCVRVATPIYEMSWTSYGPFHDFSILDPFLDDLLALKSKTLSPFFILSDFESTFLFFAYCFFCFSCDSVTFFLLLI